MTVELSGKIDAVTAAHVLASVDSSRGRPPGDGRAALRAFALAIIPALCESPKVYGWILLDEQGTWTRYVGNMPTSMSETAAVTALEVAARDAGLVGSWGIFGQGIFQLWAQEPRPPKSMRRNRSPESIELSRAKAKAAWARKKAAAR